MRSASTGSGRARDNNSDGEEIKESTSDFASLPLLMNHNGLLRFRIRGVQNHDDAQPPTQTHISHIIKGWIFLRSFFALLAWIINCIKIKIRRAKACMAQHLLDPYGMMKGAEMIHKIFIRTSGIKNKRNYWLIAKRFLHLIRIYVCILPATQQEGGGSGWLGGLKNHCITPEEHLVRRTHTRFFATHCSKGIVKSQMFSFPGSGSENISRNRFRY